jgi:hypothetical protein
MELACLLLGIGITYLLLKPVLREMGVPWVSDHLGWILLFACVPAVLAETAKMAGAVPWDDSLVALGVATITALLAFIGRARWTRTREHAAARAEDFARARRMVRRRALPPAPMLGEPDRSRQRTP